MAVFVALVVVGGGGDVWLGKCVTYADGAPCRGWHRREKTEVGRLDWTPSITPCVQPPHQHSIISVTISMSSIHPKSRPLLNIRHQQRQNKMKSRKRAKAEASRGECLDNGNAKEGGSQFIKKKRLSQSQERREREAQMGGNEAISLFKE